MESLWCLPVAAVGSRDVPFCSGIFLHLTKALSKRQSTHVWHPLGRCSMTSVVQLGVGPPLMHPCCCCGFEGHPVLFRNLHAPHQVTFQGKVNQRLDSLASSLDDFGCAAWGWPALDVSLLLLWVQAMSHFVQESCFTSPRHCQSASPPTVGLPWVHAQ